MRRVYVLVEGQTEEVFVLELLQPHFARQGLYLFPIIVRTSPGHRGGVVSFAKIRPQIMRLCKQESSAIVTTLFDLYALPVDFPGKGMATYPGNGSGVDKAVFLEKELRREINQSNFIPNLMVHEFEALLFVQPGQFGQWTDDPEVVTTLQAIRQKYEPEAINDSPHTAPSKRILAAMPGYQKTLHGPLIAIDIGLDAMRAQCPHFNGWLQLLEALPA